MYIFLKYVINVWGFLRSRSQFWNFIVIFMLSASKLKIYGYYYRRSIRSVKICCPVNYPEITCWSPNNTYTLSLRFHLYCLQTHIFGYIMLVYKMHSYTQLPLCVYVDIVYCFTWKLFTISHSPHNNNHNGANFEISREQTALCKLTF